MKPTFVIFHKSINANLGNFCDPPYNVTVKNDFMSAVVAAGHRRPRLYSNTCSHIREQNREQHIPWECYRGPTYTVIDLGRR